VLQLGKYFCPSCRHKINHNADNAIARKLTSAWVHVDRLSSSVNGTCDPALHALQVLDQRNKSTAAIASKKQCKWKDMIHGGRETIVAHLALILMYHVCVNPGNCSLPSRVPLTEGTGTTTPSATNVNKPNAAVINMRSFGRQTVTQPLCS
jgi:hypothetical protein